MDIPCMWFDESGKRGEALSDRQTELLDAFDNLDAGVNKCGRVSRVVIKTLKPSLSPNY